MISSDPTPVVSDGKAGSPKTTLNHHQLVTFLKVMMVVGRFQHVHADKPEDFLRIHDHIYHHRHNRTGLYTTDSPSHI